MALGGVFLAAHMLRRSQAAKKKRLDNFLDRLELDEEALLQKYFPDFPESGQQIVLAVFREASIAHGIPQGLLRPDDRLFGNMLAVDHWLGDDSSEMMLHALAKNGILSNHQAIDANTTLRDICELCVIQH